MPNILRLFKYLQPQELEIEIELTTTHQGHFEFRLCVNNNPSQYATDACLDEHLLQLADGSGTKYPITTENVNKLFFC